MRIALLLITIPLFGPANSLADVEIDMRPHWDATIPLDNPHKGWYHHFPDNHPDKYVIADDDDLLEFPGMDHLYIRLAWSYLEPREGEYRWEVIDRLIDKWVAHGLGISLRISCKETSTDRIEQQFATPKWVMEAGARGGYYRNGQPTGPEGPWEPVFDDPVFLEKLEAFLKAFGARYDGKPWLRYVDIGGIGDWGEGHTHSGSRIKYNIDQRKIHIDLYCKYFRNTQLVISDDFVWDVEAPSDREPLHGYVLRRNISYRDDSPLVNGYVRSYADTYTVRSPEFFRDAYLKTPTVFELQHYSAVKRDGNWIVKEGSSLSQYAKGESGPDFFRGALELLHATYIGYHGDAREWLDDNPELTVELLNRCGYWYFLHSVKMPKTWKAGASTALTMTWENRGVAPAYKPYQLRLRLRGSDTLNAEMPSGNRKWLPVPVGKTYDEAYRIELPDDLKPGEYSLQLKLYSPAADRDVLLPLKQSLRSQHGFHTLGKVRVE